MNYSIIGSIEFPHYTGIRCLMMPYTQGDPFSVPLEYRGYTDVISELCIKRGEIGYLTIDESLVTQGKPHRGSRARYDRAIHTEAGKLRGVYNWGGGTSWGGSPRVTLDADTEILIASDVDESCAVWDATHDDTSEDGDLGHVADLYPLDRGTKLRRGEVCRIGILTPHESLPALRTVQRQFLRIVGAGVHGREEYFTENQLMKAR